MCADAISLSINESRNIIFVVTDTFAEKIWGSFEIERAKFEKYSGDLQKIIIIRKNVSLEKYPSELGRIENDVLSIDWVDTECENGWDKLRMGLFSEIM